MRTTCAAGYANLCMSDVGGGPRHLPCLRQGLLLFLVASIRLVGPQAWGFLLCPPPISPREHWMTNACYHIWLYRVLGVQTWILMHILQVFHPLSRFPSSAPGFKQISSRELRGGSWIKEFI